MENEQKIRMVKKVTVNAPETILTIPRGETVSISCAEYFSLSTARSAASRLNAKVGWKEFEVKSPDNGATLNITRKPFPMEAIKL